VIVSPGHANRSFRAGALRYLGPTGRECNGIDSATRRIFAMKKIELLSIALLLLAASTAAGQDVRYNFDKDTDFSKFKTFKWVTIKDSKLDDLRDKQIKDAVEAELAKKGLTKTEAGTADLYVGYQAGIGTEKQFTSYNTGWGYGPGWYGGGWYGGGGVWHGGGGGMTTGQTSTIYVGQLAVDFYDSKNHDLVWRGVASKTLDPKAKPEKQQKNLDKAVAKLLKNYPPPPPKAK
jgi:hypothetical protein